MKNNILGVCLLVTIGLLTFTVIFESMMTMSTADGLYTVSGCAIYIFGIWSGARLISSK